jgi:hypothetical protein
MDFSPLLETNSEDDSETPFTVPLAKGAAILEAELLYSWYKRFITDDGPGKS